MAFVPFLRRVVSSRSSKRRAARITSLTLLKRSDFSRLRTLFRWFVGLGIEDATWDQTTFGKNRDRLLAGDVAHKFLAAVLAHPKVKRLLSTEHFSVDGTMIEAWASMKSVRPKDGSGGPPAPGRNGEANFHGERRTNETHQSTTDPIFAAIDRIAA